MKALSLKNLFMDLENHLLTSTSKVRTQHNTQIQFKILFPSGRRVPILVSEQGVGRGEEPITSYLNNQTEGVGGHWYTTYAPKPLYLTSLNRSMAYDNSEVTFIIYVRWIM